MLKHHIIFSCMLSFALSACAQNLLKNGDASAGMENWTGRIQAVQDPDMPGAACFKFLSGGGTSSELIQIEPAKTYKLSGKFW